VTVDDSEVISVHTGKLTDALITGKNHGQIDAVTIIADHSGLWADVCLAYPAIEAATAGYDVVVPEDTIGCISQLSHDNGTKRMEAARVKPITWNIVLAELQRDHARSDTEKEVTRIFMEYLFKMDPDKEWK
jgi:hypothetical protein